jgi:predicted acyltransferase (DUF342 family)
MEKNNVMRNNQSGFTLVTVLLLSSLASILVLTSLKDNITQERLSGNYQKKVNARLVSERGVFESINAVKLYLSDPANKNATLAEIEAAMAIHKYSGDSLLGGAHYDVTASSDGDVITLSSQGNLYEGQKTLKARFKFTAGSSGGHAPFADAVVGCDGVSLQGSGRVDSYDSSDSDTFSTVDGKFYGISVVGNEADVSTINQNADVTLTGNSPVHGDINSTGAIILTGSAKVFGSLHANSDITTNQGDVGGSVKAGGSYKNQGGTVRGQVRVKGRKDESGEYIGVVQRNWAGKVSGNASVKYTVQMGSSAKILNLAPDSDSELDGLEILYNGEGKFDSATNNSHYDNEKYKPYSTFTPVSENDPNNSDAAYKADPATTCDHLDIATVTNDVQNGATDLRHFVSKGNSSAVYTLLTNSLNGSAGSGLTTFSSTNESVLGKATSVIKMASFKLKNDTLNVGDVHRPQDVTIFVEGDFETSGGGRINILAGSSLTLIIKGKIIIKGEGVHAEQHGLANAPNSLPAMSIYSSYESSIDNAPSWDKSIDKDPGILIGSNSPIYAQIYSPLGVVSLQGSGHLYGAVRGKKVLVPGGTKIHYDAALGSADRGGSDGGVSTSSSIEFKGFKY